MAETLSESTGAGRLLDDLYRHRLFTDSRLGAEPIYQFHALFRHFLQRRATEALGGVDARRTMARSAQVLEANGDVEHAMELRIAARDWDGAVTVIHRGASALLKSGRWQTLERWIQALPAEIGECQARLLYWLGMAQVPVEPARGVATLRRAREAFRLSPDREGNRAWRHCCKRARWDRRRCRWLTSG